MKRKTAQDYFDLANRRGFKFIGPMPKNTTIRTSWECPNGHTFEQAYGRINVGNGCPECSGKRKLTIEDYKKLGKKNGFQIIGDKPRRNDIKTQWICSEGHEFEMAYNYMDFGGSCPRCAKKGRKVAQDYHNLASRSGLKFVGEMPKRVVDETLWKCCEGHQFSESYNRIDFGGGCLECSGSSAENKIDHILKSVNVRAQREISLGDIRNKKSLRFDFWLPDLQVAIEYQGKHHYEPIKFWGGAKKFKEIQANDQIKRDFCKSNGYTLLEIPYAVRDLKQYLVENLPIAF